MKLNLGCGPIILPGFVNLDLRTDLVIPSPTSAYDNTELICGWNVRNGLDYKDESIDAITISHLFCNLLDSDFPGLFKELYRVLKHGGVVRITDENCDQPLKRKEELNQYRQGLTGHPDRFLFYNLLKINGFVPHDVSEKTTWYRDNTLMQNLHNDHTIDFYIEGVKP